MLLYVLGDVVHRWQDVSLLELAVSESNAWGVYYISVRRSLLKQHLMRLWFETEGQDLSEYALILLFGSLLTVAAVGPFALGLSHLYSSSSAHVATVNQHKSTGSSLSGLPQSIHTSTMKVRPPGETAAKPPSRSIAAR